MSDHIHDKDGFPPCAMTVDEFCAEIRTTFPYERFRIIAFKVRGYTPDTTLTSQRGVMNTKRATPKQVEACKASLAKSDGK